MKNNKIGMAINYDYPDYGGMLQAYASETEKLNILQKIYWTVL